MWVADTWKTTGAKRKTYHDTEREADSAAAMRATNRWDLSITYEIPDEPVLPGWSERTAA